MTEQLPVSNSENQTEKQREQSPARLLLRLLAFVAILAAILFISAGRLVQFCPETELTDAAPVRHT